MADVKEIKYVSPEKLGYYDLKIKAYLKERDDALQANIDLANQAITAEETRAKAAELANSQAAQAAKDAADAVAAKVGTVADGKTVMGIINEIQENAYDDTELRGLISGLDTNKADKTQVATDIENAIKVEKERAEGIENGLAERLGTVEEDYLKGADKTELANAINTEKLRAEGVESGLDERLAEVEAFFKLAEGESLDTALDTLVEIQEYLDGEGEVADQMLLDIAANKKAIEDHAATDHDFAGADAALKNELTAEINKKADATRVETLEKSLAEGGATATAITNLQEAVNTKASQADLEELEGVVNGKANASDLEELEGVVAGKADSSTVTELAGTVATKAAQADLEALQGVVAGKVDTSVVTELSGKVTTAEGKISTLEGEMDAVEAAVATKAEASALTALQTGAVATNTADITALKGKVEALESVTHTEITSGEIDQMFATATV